MTGSAGNAIGISMRTPEPSPRLRKDATTDVRVGVGRHRDKLEQIRDSLRPFEQTGNTEAPTSASATSSSPNNNNSHNNFTIEDETRRQILINTLTQIGFEEQAALLALELVRYSSVAAAAEVLLNLNKEHVFRQDLRDCGGNFHGSASVVTTTSPQSYTSNNNSTISSNSKLAVTTGISGQVIGTVPVPAPVSGLMINAQIPTTSLLASMDDSSSSRSNSPLARIPSPPAPTNSFQVRSTSPSLQIITNPYHQASEYHRLHTHFPIDSPKYCYNNATKTALNNYDYGLTTSSSPQAAAAVSSFTSTTPLTGITYSRKMDRPSTQQTSALINIDGLQGCSDRIAKQTRTLASRSYMNGSAINGTGGSTVLRRSDAVPVIRTRLERPVNVRHPMNPPDSLQKKSDPSRYNKYAVNGVDEETVEIAATHGNLPTTNGIQRILVDPDRPSSGYTNYAEQLCRRTNLLAVNEHDSAVPGSYPELNNGYHRTSNVAPTRSISPKTSGESDEVTRCISPLPENILRKLRTNTYESIIKPCKPRLFCFYMEQHVERLIQQYKERQQRARQLAREMECADLPESMREHMMIFLTQKESRYLRLKRQKMNKDMFEVVKHIGFGAFGRVSLVKKKFVSFFEKDTCQVYAMKKLLKKDVIMKQQAAHVKAERDILAEADSNWIVKLYYSFQDEQSLYLIMEYVPGGDMMQLLINKGLFDEKLARFYISELTCAIEYVHGLGFIHRDIKPDNILIDQNGHIKLTDFGLCTGLRWTHDKRYYGPDNDEVENTETQKEYLASHLDMPGKGRPKVLEIRNHCKRNQSHSLVGTDNYMAPEVIRGTGVILYEMVFGRPPFLSEDRYETQYKIVKWRQYLDLNNRIGEKLSLECIDVIRKLCCEQEDRLGCKNGAEDLKIHPWFKGIDFSTLRSTRAEYIPRVEHAEDTSNFDTFEFDSSDQSFDTVAKRASASAAFNPAFYEFTFRHFFDFDGQGCPSFRKRRPSLAPLLEATGATVTTHTGTSNHNRINDHRNNNNNGDKISSNNMKFRSTILAPTLPSTTATTVRITQGDEYESDDSLVV
uniref:non-specific serine/threonine protein kinase n=1 Tax=Setaria digitata TaxID=48799 RepID=A0A915PU94_9BILA